MTPFSGVFADVVDNNGKSVGDGAKRDNDGDLWLLGRVDDVMNISGHRISSACPLGSGEAEWGKIANGGAPSPLPGTSTLCLMADVREAVQDRRSRRADRGVESNSRLTGTTAAVLLVLLAAEGVTVLSIRSLLTPHVFIGMLLVPPVMLKIGSTTWRMARYYRGAPAYRRKGPPPPLLRLLGPVVVVLTVVMLVSGIALLLLPGQQQLLFVHKASFVLWFAAMVVHVLGHLVETTHLAPLDLARRTRRQVGGAGVRQWSLAASVVVGALLGWSVLGRVAPYLAQVPHRH